MTKGYLPRQEDNHLSAVARDRRRAAQAVDGALYPCLHIPG